MSYPCPVCGSLSHIEIDRRDRVPLLQNRVWPDREAARAAPAGRLQMLFCTSCQFAWNAAFDATLTLYDPAYDNDQMQSGYFRTHVTSIADTVLAALPSNETIDLIEIGCGQGAFLAVLAERGGDRIGTLTGFDPAWRGVSPNDDDRIKIHPKFFGKDSLALLGQRPDIVVSRHTIEHVQDPVAFLTAIRATMAGSESARLFLETPDISWILQNLQLQDLFYEHCSIFSPYAFEVALTKSGFEPLRIESRFGGQYLWVEAKPAMKAPQSTHVSEDLEAYAYRFAEYRNTLLRNTRASIQRLARDREVFLWGGASKGVTFALLMDLDGVLLKGAVDINVNKIGRFMPLTGLPILAGDAVSQGAAVLVMNPNYTDEISAYLSARDKRASLFQLEDIAKAEA